MPATESTPARPKHLLNAIISLYAQAALNVFGGVLLLYFAAADAERGRDVPGHVPLLGWLSLRVAAVLLAGAIMLARRVGWIRVPVTVIEVIGIVSGLVTLVSSAAPTGVINIVLAVIVLTSIYRQDTEQWLNPLPF